MGAPAVSNNSNPPSASVEIFLLVVLFYFFR